MTRFLVRSRWLMWTAQGGWFRLWPNGPGLQALHRSSKPLFSERYGFRRFWPAWPARWRFRILWGRR
jgi:hypothetical protein